MRRLLFCLTTLLFCAGCRTFPNSEGFTVRRYRHKEHLFDVVCFNPSQYTLKILWKDQNGKRFGRLDAIPSASLAAVNGGIFSTAFEPLGLYVEMGKELVPLNRSSGGGNFFLEPRGILVVERSGRVDIVSLKEFSPDGTYRYALQAGPVMVSGGRINPLFRPFSFNRFIRNAVGIDAQGRVFLVLSVEPVSFFDLAVFCKESLGCPDALYLDGSISRMYAPPLRWDRGGDFASILTVEKRRDGLY